MDFDLSEEQRAFQATAREFARVEMMPFARDWDERETFPVATLRKAAALGFGAICVRDDVGGSALSRLDSTIIFEELAQVVVHRAASHRPEPQTEAGDRDGDEDKNDEESDRRGDRAANDPTDDVADPAARGCGDVDHAGCDTDAGAGAAPAASAATRSRTVAYRSCGSGLRARVSASRTPRGTGGRVPGDAAPSKHSRASTARPY